MQLVGRTSSKTCSYVSFLRDGMTEGANGRALFLICAGDRGVVEHAILPKSIQTRDIVVPGPVAFAERDVEGHYAIVGSGDRSDSNPRRVTLYSPGHQIVLSKQFKTPIVGVKFSRKGHLLVCLEDCIYRIEFKTNQLREVRTGLNPKGIFSVSDDGKLLAFPLDTGVIGVLHGEEILAQIRADFAFGRLQFNHKGAGKDLLAASSEEGKSVVVWSVARPAAHDKGAAASEKLFEFTRSQTHSCRVEGIDFNAESTLLSLATDSGTLHVFELSDANKVSSGFLGSWIGRVPMLSTVPSKLRIRLPSSCSSLACLLVNTSMLDFNPPEAAAANELGRGNVFIVTSEGFLLEYEVVGSANDPTEVPNTDLTEPVRREKVFS